MRGYEALAEGLVAEGTEIFFGLMGDGNLQLINELVWKHGCRFVAVRHEAAAVTMAEAYARVSGRPGVCTVTHGPALTQTATSLLAARIAHSSVLVLAADAPRSFRFHRQRMNQGPFVRGMDVGFRALRLPDTIREDLALALRDVSFGRPTVLSTPTDMLEANVGDGAYVPSSAHRAPDQAQRPDRARVAALARALRDAERPVILAGAGAVASDAATALVEVAERSGAMLATTLKAKGMFRGEDHDLGLAGNFSTRAAASAFRSCDLLVAFGASLNQFTMGHGSLFDDAAVFQVDVDQAHIGFQTPIGDGIVADARETAQALLDADLLLPHGPGPWIDIRAMSSEEQLDLDREFDDGLDPRAVALTFNQCLPQRRQVVIGNGHFLGYPSMYVDVDDPAHLVLLWELGSIGRALAAGIGAAVARPDVRTVVFEGDGSLMMSLPELDTAVRCGIPVMVAVLDDRAYGAEYHKHRMHGFPPDLAEFASPDFAAVGRAMGMRATSVDSMAALRAAIGEYVEADPAPCLIHVPISRRVVNDAIWPAAMSARMLGVAEEGS